MMSALLIDKSHLILSRLTDRLLDTGCFNDVRWAYSKNHALELLNGFSPRLIVLDAVLVDAHAAHAIPHIKQQAPQAKVVIYTNWIDNVVQEQSLQQGADGFFDKAGDLDLFVNELLDLSLRPSTPTAGAVPSGEGMRLSV